MCSIWVSKYVCTQGPFQQQHLQQGSRDRPAGKPGGPWCETCHSALVHVLPHQGANKTSKRQTQQPTPNINIINNNKTNHNNNNNKTKSTTETTKSTQYKSPALPRSKSQPQTLHHQGTCSHFGVLL
jgi:hypothetical protein